MKKKIISSILSLAMLLSLLPISAFAASGDDVILAPLGTNTTEGGFTGFATTYSIDISDLANKNIKITATGLKRHDTSNSGTNYGYWVGVGIKRTGEEANTYYHAGWGDAPSSGVTYVAANAAEGNFRDNTLEVGGVTYDTFYFNAASKDKGYISVANNAQGTNATTYKIDLSSIELAPPEIVAIGYGETSALAKAGIEADVAALGGHVIVSDADKQTMWVVVKDLLVEDTANYTLKLTKGSTEYALKQGLADGSSTVAPGGPAFKVDGANMYFYWTFNTAATGGSVMNKPIDAGEYTLELFYKNTTKAVATKKINIGKVTIQAAETANATNDKVAYFNADTPAEKQATIGSLIPTLPTPTLGENDTLLGWVKQGTTDVITTEALNAIKPTGNVVYTPKIAQAVTVSFDVNGGTGVVPGPIKVEKAKGFTAENIAAIGDATLTRTNYIFDGWATRSGANEPYTYTKVNLATKTFDADTTLYAQWKVAGVTNATLLDSNNATVSGTTVTAAAPAAGAEKGKLTITGCIPAPTDGTGTNYKVSYILEGKEIAETPVEVTIKADGKNLTPTPPDVTLGAIVYTVDLNGLSALAADVSIKDSGTPVVEEVKESATVDLSGTTAEAVQDKIEQTVGAFDTNNAGLSAALKTEADKIVESEGAPANAVTVDKLLAEVPADNANKANYDEIIVVPILAIELKALNPTEQTMTLQITPKIQYQAIDGDDSNVPAYPVSEPVAVSNPKNVGEVTISFAQPTFVSAPATTPLYVVHDSKYVYNATWNAGSSVYTFDNPNGFSDFVITAADPTAATISGAKYATLADAIAAVSADGTITLAASYTNDKLGSISGIDKSFTIATAGVTALSDAAAKTALINAIKGGAASGYTVDAEWDETTPTTLNVTATANSAPPSGNNGGGGGVSSNVTIDRPTNGKVSVTPTAPSKGATVTINLTPDTGYTVGTVTVTDKDGKVVELTKVNDTQYTFVMPDGKVTVKATFTKVDAPATGFTDVPADAYYADAVKWAVDKGITNGLTATTFGPNNSCTRGQMVTFLWRAAGSPAATGTNSFSDVASGEYYYNAVLWAVEKGITNGTSATTFSPNATVNRGQTVTFLYRYAESPAATGDTSFTDVAADAFYADAVKWAVAEEITNGTSSTTFSPASNCTRGQIVTFMYRQMAE